MLLAILSLGCEAVEEEPACDSFPEAAEANEDRTLGLEEDCGYWLLAVGDFLAVSLHLTDDIEGHEEEILCDTSLGEGLEVTDLAGTYTNLEGDGPKCTLQVYGEEPTERADLDITCFEGTEWHARVQVE